MTPMNQYLQALSVRNYENSFAQVNQLIRSHLQQFAFSSINSLLGRTLSLAPDDLTERVVIKRQGGYCFEHNKLMYTLLQLLGYEVRPVIARVMVNGRNDNPRSHRLTVLRWQQKTFLVDVGFGVLTPAVAIELDNTAIQSAFGRQYRVEARDGEYLVWQVAPEQVCLYQVSLARFYEQDCEVAHFYSHRHDKAAFVNNLVVSRITAEQRWLLRNDSFTHFELQQGRWQQHQQAIRSVDHLHCLLSNQLQVNISLADSQLLFQRFVNKVEAIKSRA